MTNTRRDFLGLVTGAALGPVLAANAQSETEVPVQAASVDPVYRIHPAIGVARLGDSGSGLSDPFQHPDTFYVSPETIGGQPYDFDPADAQARRPVSQFKDAAGQVRRQAARFQIFRDEGDRSTPIQLSDEDITSIRWTVHIANKKAVWYDFDEFAGNLMFGDDNSYEATGTALRNAFVTDPEDRRKRLVIDPGPRTLSAPGATVQFNDAQDPLDPYTHRAFPGRSGVNTDLGFEGEALYPYVIDTLGQAQMGLDGSLYFLGGYGRTGGAKENAIASYAGADGFFDDTSDGLVRAEVTLASGAVLKLDAWVMAVPPKFAPELVNITTYDDLLFDLAARHKGAVPEIFDIARAQWNENFIVDFDRDIAPVFHRMRSYHWVSDPGPMALFASPSFDIRDNSDQTRAARQTWFGYLRDPGQTLAWNRSDPLQGAFAPDGYPLMPLNAGSNPVTNADISKFLSLTPTQYFLLKQWAAGKFNTSGGTPTAFRRHPLDAASVGNCVGAPMSPGIEVTWSVRNPSLYQDSDPYRVLPVSPDKIASEGLSATRDETRGGGCEPGDLTKRMAIPWQADFFLCGAQPVSIRDPLVNKTPAGSSVLKLPPPPTVMSYWWPPQRPMHVFSGALSANEQVLDGGVRFAERVAYTRGINTPMQAILAWRYLGFIQNQNTGQARGDFPFFVEKERDYTKFEAVKAEFSGDGVLRADSMVEEVLSQELTRFAKPHYRYIGPR